MEILKGKLKQSDIDDDTIAFPPTSWRPKPLMPLCSVKALLGTVDEVNYAEKIEDRLKEVVLIHLEKQERHFPQGLSLTGRGLCETKEEV
ncbi:hypothetical protein DVH24_039708 [Malus domestica]|uniref:Uncharacterized protein n=1 Tax=Malus domestica TaxID=3750 RepID=A0A498I710_MALDO|nr:hypothetical protein DVH24_039708 [Malus domestica]